MNTGQGRTQCRAGYSGSEYLYILKEVEGKDVPQRFPAIICVVKLSHLQCTNMLLNSCPVAETMLAAWHQRQCAHQQSCR